jgi:hypothetical protein
MTMHLAMDLWGAVGDLHKDNTADECRQAEGDDAGGPGFERFHRVLPWKCPSPVN